MQCYTIEGLKKAIVRKKSVLSNAVLIVCQSKEFVLKELSQSYDGIKLFGISLDFDSMLADGIVKIYNKR